MELNVQCPCISSVVNIAQFLFSVCPPADLMWYPQEEPLASLLKLRDAKKAWFLSRRQPQRQCVAQNNDCSSCYVQKHSRDELLVDCGAVLGERVRINGAHSGAINILEGEGERSVLCRSSDEDEL